LTNQRSNIIPEKGKGKKVESSRPNNLISKDEIKKLKEKRIKKTIKRKRIEIGLKNKWNKMPIDKIERKKTY